MSAAPPEDVEEFIDRVDEVSRLINGLAAGTLPPDYVDRRIEEQRQKQVASAAKHSGKDAAASRACGAGMRDAAGRGGDSGAGEEGGDGGEEEARQAELMRKVEELKASRTRKLKARARFEEYVKQREAGDAAVAPDGGDGPPRAAGGVDYARWDLWCPSDEEDDLFSSLTPDTAGFRAMERDINDRHKRMVEQRQIAERQRVAGNEAMAAGQWSEALRCYEAGLDAQRHNMVLHSNAALAALKLRCFVQALEHCNKVLHLADALHGTPRAPLCVKALQRRAAAREGLGQMSHAVKDLEQALELTGGKDAEIEAQLSRAQALVAEAAVQRQLSKLLSQAKDDGTPANSGSLEDTAASSVGQPLASSADVGRLKKVEELAGLLGREQRRRKVGAEFHLTDEAVQACGRVAELLVWDESCRTYFRTCGGLQAAADRLVECSAAASTPRLPARPPGAGAQPSISGTSSAGASTAAERAAGAQTALLRLLEAATLSDLALETVAAHGELLAAAARLLGSAASAVQARAVRLLQVASVPDKSRPGVCAALTAENGKGLARLLALSVRTKDASVQGAALSLTGNCMLRGDVRNVAARLLATPQGGVLLQGAVGLLAGSKASQLSASPDTQSKAAAMLGNACAHPGLRLLLVSERLLAALLRQALPSHFAVAEASAAQAAAAEAAAGCLLNLLAEPAAQELLALERERMTQLLGACCGSASTASPVVRERLAGALARTAKHPAGLDVLGKLDAAPAIIDALAVFQQQQGAEDAKGAGAATTCWLDGMVRVLTQVTARPGACAALTAEAIGEAIKALVWLCSLASTQAAEVLAGNAACCLGNFVAEPALRPALLRAGGVDALLAVARTRRGSAASRNAAVALAKAAGDGGVLERLRELRALEVIMEYVPRP